VATKISVITSCFNHAPFIRETIESILSQNYPDLEYIVIDGGSTDGSAEIIREYESRLSYFVSEPDRGHGHALNKGFEKSTGEIMAWLNSDDKYMPKSLQTVADIFDQHQDVEWLTGTNGWWNDRGVMIRAANNYKNAADFIRGDFAWIQQESTFWRRSLWEKSGAWINETYKFMVDGELWTKFFLYAELYHAHCILSGYRSHGDNRALHNYDACISEMQQAINHLRPQLYLKARPRYPVLDYVEGQWVQNFIKSPSYPEVMARKVLRRIGR
jgi:glycosyltransferase involved in cell wall biosynthesis